MIKLAEIFTENQITYSHKEQSGMLKCQYMWKSHKYGKTGVTEIWVASFEKLIALCRYWSEKQPENWFYLPLTFKNAG